jgi:hypothetical protein
MWFIFQSRKYPDGAVLYACGNRAIKACHSDVNQHALAISEQVCFLSLWSVAGGNNGQDSDKAAEPDAPQINSQLEHRRTTRASRSASERPD